MSDEREVLTDWPMPRHGDPVWVTVSEYDLSYLKRVMEKAGSLRATHLLHWAMDAIIGRGISHDWESVVLAHISSAIQILEAKGLDGTEMYREPMFQSEGEVGPVSLRHLIGHNVQEGEMGLTPGEINRLCTMEVGDTMRTGGGSFASTEFTRVI